MKLIVKFNLMCIGVFVLASLVAAWIAHGLLLDNAREEILQNARLMMQSALAARDYTSTQIKPLLAVGMQTDFLPQSVPAYAATELFEALRKKYPEYSYREATLNPTNLRDRATDWESDLIGRFKQDAETKEIVGARDTPTGPSQYLARPIRITDAGCLTCHSTPDAAPKTLIARYGSANGFGWTFNDIIGAQVISVPGEIALDRAHKAFVVFVTSLSAVFAVIFIAINALLYFVVIRPVTRLSRIADEVSLGNLEAPEFAVASKDEIGALASSFGRMRKSLAKAISLLDQ